MAEQRSCALTILSITSFLLSLCAIVLAGAVLIRSLWQPLPAASTTTQVLPQAGSFLVATATPITRVLYVAATPEQRPVAIQVIVIQPTPAMIEPAPMVQIQPAQLVAAQPIPVVNDLPAIPVQPALPVDQPAVNVQPGMADLPPPATPASSCDPAYPDVCIPSPPPDLDCPEIPFKNFRVLQPDPHRLDQDNDGIGCEQ